MPPSISFPLTLILVYRRLYILLSFYTILSFKTLILYLSYSYFQLKYYQMISRTRIILTWEKLFLTTNTILSQGIFIGYLMSAKLLPYYCFNLTNIFTMLVQVQWLMRRRRDMGICESAYGTVDRGETTCDSK